MLKECWPISGGKKVLCLLHTTPLSILFILKSNNCLAWIKHFKETCNTNQFLMRDYNFQNLSNTRQIHSIRQRKMIMKRFLLHSFLFTFPHWPDIDMAHKLIVFLFGVRSEVGYSVNTFQLILYLAQCAK